jgi:hypothetical protein
MKKETTRSSETSVDFQQTTRNYIREDRALYSQLCENLKSYEVLIFLFLSFSFFLYGLTTKLVHPELNDRVINERRV